MQSEAQQETKKFEGWALLELFGHAKEAGYVTTEYFGSVAMFRVDVPELPEREIVLERPEWLDNIGERKESKLVGVGSKIQRGAVAGRTRYVGPGALYSMNPCSQEAALRAVEAMSPRQVKIIELIQKPQPTLARGCGCAPGEDCDICCPI